jgi:hypothetical protein
MRHWSLWSRRQGLGGYWQIHSFSSPRAAFLAQKRKCADRGRSRVQYARIHAGTTASLGFNLIKCFGQVCVARRVDNCRALSAEPMPVPAPLNALEPRAISIPDLSQAHASVAQSLLPTQTLEATGRGWCIEHTENARLYQSIWCSGLCALSFHRYVLSLSLWR